MAQLRNQIRRIDINETDFSKISPYFVLIHKVKDPIIQNRLGSDMVIMFTRTVTTIEASCRRKLEQYGPA